MVGSQQKGSLPVLPSFLLELIKGGHLVLCRLFYSESLKDYVPHSSKANGKKPSENSFHLVCHWLTIIIRCKSIHSFIVNAAHTTEPSVSRKGLCLCSDADLCVVRWYTSSLTPESTMSTWSWGTTPSAHRCHFTGDQVKLLVLLPIIPDHFLLKPFLSSSCISALCLLVNTAQIHGHILQSRCIRGCFSIRLNFLWECFIHLI